MAVAAIQVSEFQKQGEKNWGRGVRAVKRETIDLMKREPTMEFALIDT
jgi:hypothetical protein